MSLRRAALDGATAGSDLYWMAPPPRAGAPAAARRALARSVLLGTGLLLLAGCRGKSPEEDREALYRSSTALKRDSAATAAFFRTVLGDSVQRARLAAVILEHEGMRRTMTQALIRDSLARAPSATDPTGRHPSTGPREPPPSGPR